MHPTCTHIYIHARDIGYYYTLEYEEVICFVRCRDAKKSPSEQDQSTFFGALFILHLSCRRVRMRCVEYVCDVRPSYNDASLYCCCTPFGVSIIRRIHCIYFWDIINLGDGRAFLRFLDQNLNSPTSCGTIIKQTRHSVFLVTGVRSFLPLVHRVFDMFVYSRDSFSSFFAASCREKTNRFPPQMAKKARTKRNRTHYNQPANFHMRTSRFPRFQPLPIRRPHTAGRPVCDLATQGNNSLRIFRPAA